MKVINILDKNSQDDYFHINLPENEISNHKFIKYYNNIQSIKTNYIKNYEICSNASYERIEYYANKFIHNDSLKDSLLQLNKDDDEMVTLSANINDIGDAEYIILSTKRINNYRKILIIEFKKEKELSIKGIVFNTLCSYLVYSFIPNYKLSSFFVTFFSKSLLDLQFSNENVSKIAILKYLEDNKYINVDVENKRIRLNI